MEYPERRDYALTLCIFICMFFVIGTIAVLYFDSSPLYKNFTLPNNHKYLWFVNYFDYSHKRSTGRTQPWPRSVAGLLFDMILFPFLIKLPLFSYINKNRKATKIILLTIMTTVSVVWHSMAAYICYLVLQSPTLLVYTGISFFLSMALVLLFVVYNDFFEFVRYETKWKIRP